MPCDTVRKRKQTLSERKKEISAAVKRLNDAIVAKTVTPKISPKGAIAFAGWSEASRDDVTDACAYRRLMVEGSALAKQAITRAEQLAGRTVDKAVVAQGVHSHDGGVTWHGKG